MSKRKLDEEEQDMQDTNVVENDRVEDADAITESGDNEPDPRNGSADGVSQTDPTPDESDEEDQDADSQNSDNPDDDQDGQDDSAGESDDSGGDNDTTPDEDQDMFDRSYVEKLRKENAKYRDRAKRTDELAHRLQDALVAADGRLADPEDLEYDDAYLDDPEALQDAITDLIKRKPGLRARKFTGDVGAGERGSKQKAPVDLLQIMKSM